jgi:Cof subfamily protein (haloacid dehalogenase superfamily)
MNKSGAKCRLFVTDLDGTVLVGAEKGCFLPERTKKALGALHASGTTVVLASGRMHESVRVVADSLGFQGPVISYNGAMTRLEDDSLLEHLPLRPQISDEVLLLAEERGVALNFYHEGKIYARRFEPWWDLYEGRTSSPMREVESLRPFIGKEATKLLMISDAARIRSMQDEFRARFEGRANVLVTADEYLEFMSLGVDKGAALEKLALALGIGREEIVAAGDGFNDIEMLRYAGTALAVEGGRPALKELAHAVVPGPEKGGVAEFIEKNLL